VSTFTDSWQRSKLWLTNSTDSSAAAYLVFGHRIFFFNEKLIQALARNSRARVLQTRAGTQIFMPTKIMQAFWATSFAYEERG
jgi:hypothetical protein